MMHGTINILALLFKIFLPSNNIILHLFGSHTRKAKLMVTRASNIPAGQIP